nr:hypothetical protein [Pseudomonas zeshuii]
MLLYPHTDLQAYLLIMDQTTQPLDLAQCDREPIHIPGSIQPHGILLAIDPDTQTIQQVAGDTVRFLTRNPTDLLGQPVDTVFGAEAATSLLTLEPDMTEPLYLGSLSPAGNLGMPVDLTAHICNGVLFLELEPSSEHQVTAAQRVGEIHRVLTIWSATTSLHALLKSVVRSFAA